MPPKQKKCTQCGTTVTSKWFTLDRWTLCYTCYDLQLNPPLEPVPKRSDSPVPCCSGWKPNQNNQSNTQPDSESNVDIPSTGLSNKKPTVSTKVHPTRQRGKKAIRGKTRRTVQKRLPSKPPGEVILTTSVPKLFHDNFWYEIGDIVSLVDMKDNTYYAQIRALLKDVFNEKSAVITWLVPTVASPPPNEGFDPATYQIGPNEEEPRPLSEMSFVMHAPSSFYFDRHHPFPFQNKLGPMNELEIKDDYIFPNISHLHFGKK